MNISDWLEIHKYREKQVELDGLSYFHIELLKREIDKYITNNQSQFVSGT